MDIKTLKKVQANFLKELEDASAGKKTSLAYIVHQLPQTKIVEKDEVFQVIVTGGSVCKEAKVRYKNGKIYIVKKQEMPVSPFDTKEDFLEFILSNLDPQTKTLAVNFTFAIKPVFEKSKLDGILLNGAKEHVFEGLVGKKVGVEIEKYVFKKTKRSLNVSVANDTVCLLLSALSQYSPNQVAAGIAGTGLNFAIFQGNTIVNLEAANFNKFPPSPEAKKIDATSKRKSAWLFEKEVAGGYLYKQFNIIIKERKINYPPINSTAHLNSIANKSIPQVSQIAVDLFEKSAGLVTAQIAAITQFKKTDLIFVMEGSLFWHSLRPKVERYLKQLLPGHKTRFAKIENSEILGAAKLVA